MISFPVAMIGLVGAFGVWLFIELKDNGAGHHRQ